MPEGMRFALFIKLFMSSLFPSRPFRTYVAETWQCCSPISQKAANQTLGTQSGGTLLRYKRHPGPSPAGQNIVHEPG